MFDELECLRESPELQRLLGHYAEVADRGAWQDRLMELEDVEPRELVKLHGLLIAFSWIEQNTGNTAVCRPGAVPGCYRVTAAGVRAVNLARSVPAEGELDALAVVGGGAEAAQGEGGDAPLPRRRERRKANTASAETAETSDAPVPAEAACEPVGSAG